MIACSKWLGQTSATCTRKPDGCVCENEERNEMGNEMGIEREEIGPTAHNCTPTPGTAGAEAGAVPGFCRDAGGLGVGRGDEDMAEHGLTPNVDLSRSDGLGGMVDEERNERWAKQNDVEHRGSVLRWQKNERQNSAGKRMQSGRKPTQSWVALGY